MPKYEVILCDAPWLYRDKSCSGQRGSQFKYPSISDERLCSLPVKDIAAKDSFLFMWTTAAKLPVALEVMKSWGFKYVNISFVWVKLTKHGKPHMGMGSYSRSGSEICLLGKRGKPKVVSHSVRQVVYSPVRAHSQKPDEIRDSIVKLCGDTSRIELFSRQRHDGWDCVGDEIDGKDIGLAIGDLIHSGLYSGYPQDESQHR